LALANQIMNAGPGTAPAAVGPRDEEMAAMLTGQAPASRYAQLPFARRRILAHQLSESLRNETRTEIESDIESIRRTGEPRRLPDGTTWIERAPRILVPNQAALVASRVREAYAKFRATEGLTDMTPEQQELRLDELSPSRIAEGENYATAARVRDEAAKTIGRIQELRQRDPALAVSGTQLTGARGSLQMNAEGQLHNVPAEDDVRVRPAREVAQAFELLSRRRPDLQIQSTQDGLIVANPPDTGRPIDPSRIRPQTLRLTDPRLSPDERTRLIEARLSAMSRLGIPDYDRRILRRDEAAELLAMPPRNTDMTPAEYEQRLKAAADRAEQMFGLRYGRTAFETAINFRTLSQEQRDQALSAGRNIPTADQRAMLRLNREQEAWLGARPGTWGAIYPSPEMQAASGMEAAPFGVPRQPAPPPRSWWQSAPATQVPPAAQAPATSVTRFPKPTPQDIYDLQRFPQLGQDFDRRFGPGQAAGYLQGQAPRR
jgi:hypothetical protein